MKEQEFRERQQDLFGFNLQRSRQLRNEGLKRNEEGADEWKGAALLAFVQFANAQRLHVGGSITFIIEDFRKWWMSRPNYCQPRHPNAWGAFTTALLKAKLIRATGYVRASASLKSHARKMLEWEILEARSS